MTQRKSRRLKCRHCGKLVSRKSKNKYFCSVKCMKTAVKENYPSKPPEQEVSIGGKPYAISEDGIRELISAQDVADYEKPVLDEALDSKIVFSVPPEYDSEMPNKGVADEMGVYIDCSPHSSPLPENWKNMTQEEQLTWITDHSGPSPWQGDPPEGTLAFKLKYGEWWEKDLE